MATSAAIRLVPARSLHLSEPVHWLKSRFHFSFADYYDAARSSFGVLRVLNDDLVTPGNGFDTHPHSNMEILSYVVDGHLTHRDSMGSSETLGRGAIQFMSAGTGVRHSEHNRDGRQTLRFLQLWITPNARGLKPQYGSRTFTEKDRTNTIFHAVTGPTARAPTAPPTPDDDRRIVLSQDANIFISEYDHDHPQTFAVRPGRQAYLVCIEGALSLNGSVNLGARDAAEVTGPVDITFTTPDKAHFLLVEMAAA